MRPIAPGMAELRLTTAERTPLAATLEELVADHRHAEDPRFLSRVPELAGLLPESLRDALARLRRRQDISVLVVRGGPVGEPDVPTPRHWRERPDGASVRHDFWLALLACQLGEPVCWSTLQDARLFQDILPIPGDEREQTGHGSLSTLEFHVEDCFSDDRCDVLALLCVRNPDRTPTTVASGAALDLAALDVDTLSGRRFQIRPDPEHLREEEPELVRELRDPPARPVLNEDAGVPGLRVDPAFTAPLPGDHQAARALAELHEQIEANLVDVSLDTGDLLLVDNLHAVHGRSPFRPRYDGTDRWLRKLTVLRHPRGPAGTSPVLEPFAPRD